MDIIHEPVDDRGTDQLSARDELASICENAFEGNVEKFAVALGRPETAVREILDGVTLIDDDLMTKARGIAGERGLGAA